MIKGLTEFSLYRSGWSGDQVPWPDNQLWARAPLCKVLADGETTIDLYPEYGAANSWYRIVLRPTESPEVDWVAFTVTLSIDAYNMSPVPLPLTWYVGEPSDWPSGLARFREPVGFRTSTFDMNIPGVRGVWTLAARRGR